MTAQPLDAYAMPAAAHLHLGAASGSRATLIEPPNRPAVSVPLLKSAILSTSPQKTISTDMARPASTATWLEHPLSKITLGAVVLGATFFVAQIRSDVSELKGEVKELRADSKEIRASLAEVTKSTALTAQRLDQTNEKLQTLIDETRKRR